MIEIFVDITKLMVAVTAGTYIGSRIIKHELKKEISAYIRNELPHLLEDERFKAKTRSLARAFVRELIAIVSEELGG